MLSRDCAFGSLKLSEGNLHTVTAEAFVSSDARKTHFCCHMLPQVGRKTIERLSEKALNLCFSRLCRHMGNYQHNPCIVLNRDCIMPL